MKVSICFSTYNRPKLLQKTLESIYIQQPKTEFEVIIVDDGSMFSETQKVCNQYPVCYYKTQREAKYRNPAKPRNLAYKLAKGDILICQSDDVLHGSNVIDTFANELQEGEFLLSTVWNVNEEGNKVGLDKWQHINQLCGPKNKSHLFFLGAVWRKDIYAIGGNDEEFTEPGYEDNWLADCLINGRKLTPRYLEIEGYHQDHSRPNNLMKSYTHSHKLYKEKVAKAKKSGLWQGGKPWEL